MPKVARPRVQHAIPQRNTKLLTQLPVRCRKFAIKNQSRQCHGWALGSLSSVLFPAQSKESKISGYHAVDKKNHLQKFFVNQIRDLYRPETGY